MTESVEPLGSGGGCNSQCTFALFLILILLMFSE